LLERSTHDVEADVQTPIDSLPLKEPVNTSDVSMREVIAAALAGSDYWARLAANWLESGFRVESRAIQRPPGR
jgi:hypothetical protein